VASTSGTTPKMKANEVIKMGRNRVHAASSAASAMGLPSRRRRSLATSTIRMAFFAESAISSTRPGIDWRKGAPVMICVGAAEYGTSFPNCGDSSNRSQAFPLSYERPTVGLGVAWPSAKDNRYELQSMPILDGADGMCARYSHQRVHEIKDPQTGTYVFSAS
jgi:hypothetical protein